MLQYLFVAILSGLATIAAGAAGDSWRVRAASGDGHYAVLGTVEAVRQGDMQAQVAGHITEVLVRAGDSVRAGTPLLRIDARAAEDLSAASAAQAAGAEAQLVQARAEYARAQKLRASEYISEAAMQRAEAQLRSSEAQAAATRAQSRVAGTQAGWYLLRAPYDALVTAVDVAVGDEATPGRTLIQLYAPGAQRIVAQVPEAIARQLQPSAPALLQLDGGGTGQSISLSDWHRVPAVDKASRSVAVRAELPAGLAIEPGRMLRLLLPTAASAPQLLIPASAVIRRSEVDAVYVLDDKGAPHLRQVRLGPAAANGQVQVLAGLSDGEVIATEPQSAARATGKP